MTLEELQKEAGSRDCVVVKRREWEAVKLAIEDLNLIRHPDAQVVAKELSKAFNSYETIRQNL